MILKLLNSITPISNYMLYCGLQRTFHQEIANDTGGMMGSTSSHSLNGPQQIDPTNLVMDIAGPCNGFETL